MQTAGGNQIGAGQLDPFSSTSEFAVAAFIVRQIMAQLETMIPVQIQAVHAGSGSPPAAGTVDVQLLVSLLDGAGNQVKQGIVYGIPFFRLQGGPWAIVCDPSVNDVGILIAAARDMSKLSNGVSQQQLPGSNRQNSYSDGVYLGGVFNNAPKASFWLKSDGTFNITDKNGNTIVSSTTGMTVTDVNGNQMQMKAGAVNFVTTALEVNGVPVTVP
jgi:hypothetical protein